MRPSQRLSLAAILGRRISRLHTELPITGLLSMMLLVRGCTYSKSVPDPETSPSLPTGTPTETKRAQSVAALPLQGLYDSCVPSDAECLRHLDTLAGKGFRLILNYGQLYGSMRDIIAYADHAESLGMQVIWPISYRAGKPNNWMVAQYQDLAASGKCTDDPCLIRYVVNAVKDHLATWGYYVADEVKPAEYNHMKPWTDLLKQLDPHHPRLFVTAGSNDPMEQYYGFYSNMRDLADVFGPDYYPYGYIDEGSSLTRFTGATAAHAQYWADKLGGQSVIVLQAFAWPRYAKVPLCLPWPACAPFPSAEQMKAQRDQTLLSSHPAMILWWTYEDILKTEDPSKHLDDLAAAAFAPAPSMKVTPTPPAGICPEGWSCDDIGNPSLPGSQSIAGTTWVVRGGGWDIWAQQYVRADQFHFVWQEAGSEQSMQAEVVSQEETDRAAKAGIMFRKSIDPVSPYYAIYVTPESGVQVQYRTDYGLESQEASWTLLPAPVYLKIERSGTSFTSYSSVDSREWTVLYNSTINIPSLSGSLMAGLAVTSRNETSLGSATFADAVFR